MTGPAPSKPRLLPVDLPIIGSDAVAAYLAASLDDNPLHRDPELARKAGFEGVLLPGMLMMGQMAEVLSAWPHCDTIVELSAKFVEPVVVGTALRCEGRVVRTARAGREILRLTIRDADRRIRLIGEAVIIPVQAPSADV